ncbi:MAG: hypothetical protein RH862_02860 [Leptospiraceae bacterium]
MPPAPLDTVSDPELKAHLLAYFKLIQSVLGKRPGTPEQKRQVYQQLQKHLIEKAHSVDDLIEEIPRMASTMGVPPQNLSSFISQNFFKALEIARQDIQKSGTESGESKGPAQAVTKDPARDHDLIGELLETFGPIVQAPNKFVPGEMGAIKMMTPNGEKLPSSLTGGSSESEDATAGSSKPAATDQGPSKESTTSGPSSATSAKKVTGKGPGILPQKDEPLIQEILNKFGNHLDVHEKLEPAAFPRNFKPSSSEESTAASDDSAGSGDSAPSPAPAGVKTNAVPKSAGPVIEWPDEDIGLIQEILESFGNDLAVHGRLEPSDGLATPGSASRKQTSEPASQTAAISTPATELDKAPPSAPISFARYTEIRGQLARFQKSGDQQGYRQYLQDLGEEEKLVVPLRNLENKLQKNPSLKASDEIYHLSTQLGVSAEKLAGFRSAMLRYDRIQLLLNDFVQRVKKGPAPLMKAVQSIWSQVRLLLNQVDQPESMRSQMKFLLLGIQDPEVKKKTQEILESLLNRAHSIYSE